MNQVKGILNKNLVDAVIKLEDIYLDPNNPRFTFINENDVSNECIIDINIQKETREKLKNFFSIAKLMENIKVNGFLTIDRIVVKKIYDDKYVVLEGNRRICAAKEIMDIYKNQGEINADVIETLKKLIV